VSQCRKKTQDGSKCKGKYLLSYDGAPIFTCEVCGHQDLTWQTFYNEYLDIWRDKSKWDEKKHHVTCVIGFFCYLYREAYQTGYTFVPNNPNPYSSKECKDAQKLLSAFDGNATMVRKYLWWFFKKQFRPSISIVSLNYFNAAGLIRKYKLQEQKSKILTRASVLPGDFLGWCKEYAAQIFDDFELSTMNDLGALLSYYNVYGGDPSDILGSVVGAARERKLIVGDKLNIGG